MRIWLGAVVIGLLVAGGAVRAAEYKVEPFKEAPPKEVAPAIANLLAPTPVKVVDDENKTICEVWVAKTWATKSDFQASDTILFPLQPGSLVGVLRFKRKGADFRGQDIPAGVYTLRYANQPVDGNHVGTFDTRDFLLMVPAKIDQSPDTISDMELFKESEQSAESSHPAIMPLLKSEGGDAPAVRHIEEKEWWTLLLPGKDTTGKKLALELIVVGKAAE